MTTVRAKNLPIGGALTARATIDGTTINTAVPAFRVPEDVTALPRVNSEQHAGDILTLDTTGLTGITLTQWREVGGAVLGTGATFDTAGHAMTQIEPVVTCDQGTIVGPAVYVMMVMGMAASHIVDERAIMALVNHGDATHIAVASGLWSSPSTWLGGKVPGHGARVVIPHGTLPIYDVQSNKRLDWVRVDGGLDWSLATSTKMLVGEIIVTPSGAIRQGTGPTNRVPNGVDHNIVISGRNYADHSLTPTDIALARDPLMWGRGVICLGEWTAWGADKLPWTYAAHTVSYNAGVWTFTGVKAGDTSLTLQEVPTGWSVGDEIVIGGTAMDTYGPTQVTASAPLGHQDEIRTITGIVGNVVSWAGGLAYDHDNQGGGDDNADLNPVVMLRNANNITVQSEITDVDWRRGHTACMHHHAKVDIWNVNFFGLGRTLKRIGAGRRKSDGTFRVHVPNVGLATEAYTAQSNIISRYPVHMHKLGYLHSGVRPIVAQCYVEDAPGWAMVHHDCDVDMVENVIFRFVGAGMVSESGSEVGAWIGNVAMQATTTTPAEIDLRGSPKINGGGMIEGDTFRFGYGFAMRGRAMRVNRNVAVSCWYGYVFHHRFNAGDSGDALIAPTLSPERAHLDLQEVGQMINVTPSLIGKTQFSMPDYPITHFADNEAIGNFSGLFITKQVWNANHDVNTKLKRFKSWGFQSAGAEIEYVGVYIVDQFRCVAGPGTGQVGISIAANVYQLHVVNARIEGCTIGVRFHHNDTINVHNDFTTDDPRWGLIGLDAVDCTTDVSYLTGDPQSTKPGVDVTHRDDDWDGNGLDIDLDPSVTYPLVVGTWDTSGSGTKIDNADGAKVSNTSALGKLLPKTGNDTFITADAGRFAAFCTKFGYWQHDTGSGVRNVLVQREVISDPATGRPFKQVFMIEITGDLTGYTDNGAFELVATPVTIANKTAVVAVDGSVVIDTLAGAVGGNGTFNLDVGDYLKTDHGTVSIDYGTGLVTYSPDAGYVGTDEMHFFVHSGGRYGTERITVLINDGAAGSLETFVEDTHFGVADHSDANTIAVQLAVRPDTHGRRIDLVQYSTDGGATWHRLCHGWVPETHKITVESDGTTTIAAGAYNVRLRYLTDFDFATSAPSLDAAVGVS